MRNVGGMVVAAVIAVTIGGVSVERDAQAAVFCEKKSGAVFIRDACKRKESRVDLAALGLQGPAGTPGSPGAPGADGTARAYAMVDPSTPALVPEQTKNFTAITHPSTGDYCLTPGPGIDPLTVSAVVSPEWGFSAGSDLFAFVRARPFGPCPAGDFEVQTYQLPGGTITSSDSVAFTIVVP